MSEVTSGKFSVMSEGIEGSITLLLSVRFSLRSSLCYSSDLTCRHSSVSKRQGQNLCLEDLSVFSQEER